MFAWLWPRRVEKPPGEPPRFVVPLAAVSAQHGSKAVLEAQLRGQPKPKIIWNHVDKEIPQSQEFLQEYNETNGRVSLTIREVYIDDKGLYRCVAINEHGRDETTTYVTVEDIELLEKSELRQAPQITLPLQPQIVPQGSSIDLLTKYEAFPPPTIKWYQHGKEIKPSRDFMIDITKYNETSLHIEELFEDDSGEYEVRIFNEAGEARTTASVLITKPEEEIDLDPPKFTKLLAPQTVPEGEVAILEVQVTARPEADFTWYRHGQEIIENPDLEVQITSENNKSSLILGEVYDDDSGDYTVAAQNEVGRTACTATLLVEPTGEGDEDEDNEEVEAPVFNPTLTPIRVMDGEEVRFSCKVKGKPMPKLSWFHNGRPIGNQREVRLTQTPEGRTGLYILEVFPEDAGDYTCIARNRAGEARTTANLTVESYEYRPESETGTITSTSDKQIFSGSVSEDDTLEIVKSESSDSEDSEAGSCPYFCQKLEKRIEIKEESSVRLLAKIIGYPRPEIKWYADGQPIGITEGRTIESYEDGTEALTLNSVVADDCGEYTCEAMNRNGIDTTTTQLVILPEHEPGTKGYRKPDWVIRMEELKTAMSGIVERSRARKIAGTMVQLPQSSSSSPNPPDPNIILEQQPSKNISVLENLTQSHPACGSTHVNSVAFVGAMSPNSSIHVDSLNDPSEFQSPSRMSSRNPSSGSDTEFVVPPKSQVPSCMSSRQTSSECDAEFGSHTEIESHTDSQCSESAGDHLAHLEVASSMSIGDLSMGSDSVFISETETISDVASRRPSSYAINPIYLTEDQLVLEMSKSSLLSPSTKHVTFKFDADASSGTISEDERQTDSPNFAQSVLSNYLSSHRNSISQVIEALSSLAQADITAEIEMTIEQNKKQKVSKPKILPSEVVKIDSALIPSIKITEVIDDNENLKMLEEKNDLKNHDEVENIIVSKEVNDKESVTNLGTDVENKSIKDSDSSDTDDFEKMEILAETETGENKVLKEKEKEQKVPLKENEKKSVKNSSKLSTRVNKAIISPSAQKVQRKSILKNTKPPVKVCPNTSVKDLSSDSVKENTKANRQLTPTLKRKPILKKKDPIVVSSSSKQINISDSSYNSKSSNREEILKKTSQKTVNIVKNQRKHGEKDGKIHFSRTITTNLKTPEKVRVSTEEELQITTPSHGAIIVSCKNICKVSDNVFDEINIETSSESTCKSTHNWMPQYQEISVSAPTTPTLKRKQRPSPPSQLPLVLSKEASLDNVRESKIPKPLRSNETTPNSTPISNRKHFIKTKEGHSKSVSNESTPSSTPVVRRKFSPKNEDQLSKLSKSISSDVTPLTTPVPSRKLSPKNEDIKSRIPKPMSREASSDSLSNWSLSNKRMTSSEPSSPMSTPQLVRKTFKQFHENTKIPMSIYQYSSTEDLEDSSPGESPRSSKDKRQRSLIKPSRAISVDRAMERSTKTQIYVSPRIQSPVLGRIPSPVSGRVNSPVSGRIQTPVMGRVQSPTPGRVQNHISGRVQSPIVDRVQSPVLGHVPRPNLKRSTTAVPKISSPGSTPKSLGSPSSTPKTILSAGSTPKTVLSPVSTPRSMRSPISTPKRVQSPVMSELPQLRINMEKFDIVKESDEGERIGARPKTPKNSLIISKNLHNITTQISHRTSSLDSFTRKSLSNPLSHSFIKSSKNCKGGLRRADSLEEFLVLENECFNSRK